MKDSDIRGLVLRRFYDLRHNGSSLIQFGDVASVYPEDIVVVANICDQLSEKGLIQWKALRTANSRNVGGGGKITAYGVDVIEGTQVSPIAITFTGQSISVSHSTNVQIGEHNTQDFSTHIARLASDVEHADLPAEAKKEAGSLISRLSELLGTFTGATLKASSGG